MNLVKQTVALLLVAALLLQMMSKLLVYTEFKVNQDFISKVLCENKTQKTSTCNGHCQLQKQLKADDNRTKTPVNNSTEKLEVQLFVDTLQNFNTFKIDEVHCFVSAYSFSMVIGEISPIFHPPQV